MIGGMKVVFKKKRSGMKVAFKKKRSGMKYIKTFEQFSNNINESIDSDKILKKEFLQDHSRDKYVTFNKNYDRDQYGIIIDKGLSKRAAIAAAVLKKGQAYKIDHIASDRFTYSDSGHDIIYIYIKGSSDMMSHIGAPVEWWNANTKFK